MNIKWISWGVLLGGIVVVAAVLAIRYGYEQAQLKAIADAKARELRWAKEAVEEGQTAQSISVHCQEAIPALAADEVCCENIRSLEFALFERDYDPHFDYSPIRSLKNLRHMFFYCTASEPVLEAAKGMESIEELAFELSAPSLDGMEVLATFPNLKRVSFEQVMHREQIEKLETTLPGAELHIPYTEESEAAARAAASP